MVFIALPWLALEITGSAAMAGAVVALTAIPGLFLSPILGTIVDRIGRKVSAIISEGLSAVAILLIPVVHSFVEIGFVLLVVLATARAIVNPAASTARKSIIPDIAGPARISLERANSIHEAVFATGFAIGPAVGAAFIALIGPYDVFIVVAVFSALSSISAMLINTVEHRGDGVSETGSLLRDTALGIKTISQTPAVLIGMSFVLTLAMIYLPTEMVILPAHFNWTRNFDFNDGRSFCSWCITFRDSSEISELFNNFEIRLYRSWAFSASYVLYSSNADHACGRSRPRL
jgi:MFS transporter, DHA3 family, macrolide efflux protein